MTETPLARFQGLLRELFQFDCADLDFGIYRILNHKRDAIRQFIEEDLPKRVEEELGRGQVAKQAAAAEALEELAEQVRSAFGADALDADGALRPDYRGTPLGRKYTEAREVARGARSAEAVAAEAFNHLWRFFSRYYEDGDFISKRRYSKDHRYAVPYNGEEVLLHWATADQYYVKSAEYFRDYQFQSRTGLTVRFDLREADVEHDNVKGDRRFFIARGSESVWDPEAQRLVVPFEYRPLAASEQARFGAKQTATAQSRLLDQASAAIRKAASDHPECLASLDELRPAGADGKTETLLEYHLRQYTRRNTSDFFIHKDLSGFLTRELDFYIKNEVLSLDTLHVGGEERAEGWFQMMRLLRSIGEHIITFLGQIEDFQKMLWEKRKFVVETNYIIAVGEIPSRYYGEIGATESQWKEWGQLLRHDLPPRSGRVLFLEEMTTLPLDTRHLSVDLRDRILTDISSSHGSDLDAMTGGLVVHAENWSALQLLRSQIEDDVRLVYIDPPYNSKTSKILYKNNYEHSSWLSMMDSRLAASRAVSARGCTHVVAIDENEQEVLGRLLSSRFPDFHKICVAIIHNKKGIQGEHLSHTHDYAYFLIPRDGVQIRRPQIPKEEWEYMGLRKWGRESERRTARNCFYPILVKGNRIVGFGSVCRDDEHPSANVEGWDGGDVLAVFPVDPKGVERKWRYSRDSVERIGHLLRVHRTRDGEVQIQKAQAEGQIKTVWDDARYIAGDYGTKWLTDLGIKVREDMYPKSVHTVEDSVRMFCGNDDRVLDYFAGSGTTAHAVMNLNREDGGRRRFVLVEVGAHFDSVLMPRIKRVILAPKWRQGAPVGLFDGATPKAGTRIVRYVRLESYEDALGNLEWRGEGRLPFDEYELNYMLDWETRDSATRLNVRKLSRPFDYSLSVRAGGRTERRTVDLPETFNFLIGLRVRTRRVLFREEGDRRHRYLVLTGKTTGGGETVVIWRDVEGWEPEDFGHESEWVRQEELTKGADLVYVNGNSAIEGARSLDAEFKRLMFGEVAA